MPGFSSDPFYRPELNIPGGSWLRQFQWSRSKWNGGHHLLPTTDSPTISACTTSTNLSSLEFQSNSTINKYVLQRGMMMEQNLKNTVPEVEPLQGKKSINVSPEEVESSEELCDKAEVNFAWANLRPQLIAALAVSWVSMIIGYFSAYTSPAEKSITRDFNLSSNQFSWVCGLMPLLAVFGGLLGGPLIEYLGRKWTLLVTNLLALLAWVVFYFAPSYYYVYGSRMIGGCAVGIATLTLPVYLGETVQPEVRGSLGLLPTAFGNIGILACFLLGMQFEWREIAGFAALLTLPFFGIIWFIPETPRWYLTKGKTEQSRKVLEWLRDKNNTDAVDKEFEDLLRTQKNSDEMTNGLSDLFSRTNVKSFLIVLGLMFFQQSSGINAVIFYTTKIFEDTGSNLEPSVCTTIIGVVNFISTFIATVLIDRLGRKALLYISSVSMIITLGILGAYFHLMDIAYDVSAISWLPLPSCIIYVLGFSLGFGPVPWLMMGEILPAKIRGPAASVATGFNWTCTFITTTTFPLLKDVMGAKGVFWLFCAFTVIGLVFTKVFVPETRGQSLEDIEKKLSGLKVRRMSSVANMKTLPGSSC